MHGARQRIKHDADAHHHKHAGEDAARCSARREIAKADRRHSLGGQVKAINNRPPFQDVKYNGARGNRSADCRQAKPNPGATSEKESGTEW